MTISRRSVVKGGAWSVPAVAMAAAAPAVATSPHAFQFIARIPSYSSRPAVTSPDSTNTCTTSVMTTTGVAAASDNTRYRYRLGKRESWNPGSSVAPRIRLKADDLKDFEGVVVTKVTIDYGFTASPLAGRTTGTWSDVTHTWTNARDDESKWDTPTRTGNVTLSVTDFKAAAAAVGNTVDTPVGDSLTFPMYHTEIKNPPTKSGTYSSKNPEANGNFLVIDAAFNYSNVTTYAGNSLVVQGTLNDKGAMACQGQDVAIFQYARFTIEYTANKVTHHKTYVVANSQQF